MGDPFGRKRRHETHLQLPLRRGRKPEAVGRAPLPKGGHRTVARRIARRRGCESLALAGGPEPACGRVPVGHRALPRPVRALLYRRRVSVIPCRPP